MPQEEKELESVPGSVSAIVRGGLRSIAASIPGAATLGQAWNEYEAHRTTERIQELLDNLREELEVLVRTVSGHGDALEQCQDFPELLEITIDKVRKEFGESKRAAYARVLARFLVRGNAHTHEDKVALLESMDSLSETDLQVFLLFQGKEEAQISDLAWRELALEDNPTDQLWELSCHLAKLESRGLILKVSQGQSVVYVRGGLTSAAARSQETKYRVLPLGTRLIEILS